MKRTTPLRSFFFVGLMVGSSSCGVDPSSWQSLPAHLRPVESRHSVASTPEGWLEVTRETSFLQPDVLTGCLESTDEQVAPGTQLPILATDGQFYVVDDSFRTVVNEDINVLSLPADSSASPNGEVAFSTTRLVFSAEGCPVEQEVLAEHTPIQGVARYYDSAYHGWTVIDSHLSFADVRHINASDWVYPWHSSVQLAKPLDDGYFVIGGGVLIGPNAILTAAHLGVDETWCYSLEPSSGEAWAAGEFSCHNIAGAAEIHPDGVDAAIVQLISPEDGPFAQVSDSPVASSAALLSSSWSQLHQNALNDSSVDRLGNENAFCRRWPRGSSFLLETPIFQGGDSGGPLWEGDRLVGLVHGEMCHMGLEKLRWWMEGQPAVHVAVHVPALMPFIAPYLP